MNNEGKYQFPEEKDFPKFSRFLLEKLLTRQITKEQFDKICQEWIKKHPRLNQEGQGENYPPQVKEIQQTFGGIIVDGGKEEVK